MTLDEITKAIDGGRNVVVRCDTEEKAVELLTLCGYKGFSWKSGMAIHYKSITRTWKTYRANTIYYVRANEQNYIMYGSYDIRRSEMHYNKNCEPLITIAGVEYFYVEYEDEVIEKSDMTIESLISAIN